MNGMAVTVEENCLTVAGRRIPILAGEFHFWRTSKDNWSRILDKFVGADLGIVSSYVAWNFHEYEMGRFDFKGSTLDRRDLEGFLRLCEEKRLRLFLRPGPYISAEWRNLGPPDYAAKLHRLDPQFLRLADRWISNVCNVVVPHLATRGGCIIAVQADNEMDPIVAQPGFDAAEQLGLGSSPGFYQVTWLKGRYGSIEKLNAAWHTAYTGFDAVKPVATAENVRDRKTLSAYFDFCRFKEWYAQEASRIIIGFYRDHGIDVPISLNVYPRFTPQNYVQFQKVADLVGFDVYPAALIPRGWRWFEYDAFVEMTRYLCASVGTPFSAEFGLGAWHGHHYQTGVITGQHVRYQALLALALGIKGLSWYMFVNRDNWYFSPVNENGEIRPELYDQVKDLVRIFKELSPPTMRKITSTSIVWYRPHMWRSMLDDVSPWRYVSQSLGACDLDYEIWDLESSIDHSKPLALYAGYDFMDETAQKKLLQKIETGMTLVCFTELPTFDIDGVHLTALRDTAGAPTPWTSWVDPSLTGVMHTVGRGRLLLLRSRPTPEVMTALYRSLRIPIHATTGSSQFLTTVHSSPKGLVLFVVNTGESRGVASMRFDTESLGIDPSENYVLSDVCAGKEQDIKGSSLSSTTIEVSPKDCAIRRISRSGGGSWTASTQDVHSMKVKV